MTDQTYWLIVQISGIIIVLVAVITLVPWRKIVERMFAPNPSKAFIYIEVGSWTDCVEGKRTYITEKGAAFYEYNWQGAWLELAVPADYGYKFLHGKRMLRVVAGNDRATYWDTETPGTPRGAMDLAAMVRGDIGVKLAWSIRSKKAMSWLMIILLIAGGLMAVYLFQQGQAKPVAAPVSTNATPANQQQPPPNYNYPGGISPGMLK